MGFAVSRAFCSRPSGPSGFQFLRSQCKGQGKQQRRVPYAVDKAYVKKQERTSCNTLFLGSSLACGMFSLLFWVQRTSPLQNI